MKNNLIKGYSIGFSQKHYENLIEVLRNNAIATDASNTALSSTL
jgi:hypothetical protein